MADVIKCGGCGTPIAVGRIEAGALHIRCKRCGYKTWVTPETKAATR